jgi:hypothetical protein
MIAQSPESLAAIAHHEAGHAVATLKSGMKVVQVWISAVADARGNFGKVEHINPYFGQALEDGDELSLLGYWELVIAMAGPAAERHYDQRRTMPASGRTEIENILSAADCSEADKKKHFRTVKRYTKNLVSKEWPAIQRVAAALLERKRLSGDKLVSLVQ